MSAALPQLDSLVFTAFGNRVIAVDRYDGTLRWSWKSDHGGAPALLLDGDRLMVSYNGYLTCLDPLTGSEVWHNPLTGMGVGISVLASVRGGSTNPAPALGVAAERKNSS